MSSDTKSSEHMETEKGILNDEKSQQEGIPTAISDKEIGGSTNHRQNDMLPKASENSDIQDEKNDRAEAEKSVYIPDDKNGDKNGDKKVEKGERKKRVVSIILVMVFIVGSLLLTAVLLVKLAYPPEKQAENLLKKYHDIVRLPEYASFTDEDLKNLSGIARAFKYLEQQPELKGLTFDFISYLPKDEEFMQEEMVTFEPRDLRKLKLPNSNYLVVAYSDISKKLSSNMDFILNYSEYQQAMEEIAREVLEITEEEKVKVTVHCSRPIEPEDISGVDKKTAIGNLYGNIHGKVFMQTDEAKMDANLDRYTANMEDLVDELGIELTLSVSLGEGYEFLNKLSYSFDSSYETGQHVYKYDMREDVKNG